MLHRSARPCGLGCRCRSVQRARMASDLARSVAYRERAGDRRCLDLAVEEEFAELRVRRRLRATWPLACYALPLDRGDDYPCRSRELDDARTPTARDGMARLMQIDSTLTCPACGHPQKETMPLDACRYFYECTACGTMLRPKPGDCCVFCSYGDVACPPIQEARANGSDRRCSSCG